MAVHILKFGGLDLTEYAINVQFDKENTIDARDIPGRHGKLIISEPTRSVLIVRATGTLAATSISSLKSTLRSWASSLGTDRQNLYAIFEDRFFTAYKRKFEVVYNQGDAAKEVAWSIEWVCDDPFTYVDDGAGGALVDTVSFSLGAGDPNPNPFTITNIGDISVPVIVEFTLGANNGQRHTLRNTTTGDSYTYDPLSISGTQLEYDFRNFTLKKDGVLDLPDWDGGFIFVDPGVNNFEVEGRYGSGQIQYIVKL